MAFIEANWCMIQQAAGWAALRVFLLVGDQFLANNVILTAPQMFIVNRFLTGQEVARIMRHYSGLINAEPSDT